MEVLQQQLANAERIIIEKDKIIKELQQKVKELSEENSKLRNAGQHSAPKNPNVATFAELEAKPVGDKPTKKDVDICFLYSDNALPSATHLVSNLRSTAKHLVIEDLVANVFNDEFDVGLAEATIARSRTMLIFLTRDVLKQGSTVFALQTALLYKVAVLLVHSEEDCNFPSPNDQTPFVKNSGIFSDKAVTYMKLYVDTCVKQILVKFEKASSPFDLLFIYSDKEYAKPFSRGILITKHAEIAFTDPSQAIAEAASVPAQAIVILHCGNTTHTQALATHAIQRGSRVYVLVERNAWNALQGHPEMETIQQHVISFPLNKMEETALTVVDKEKKVGGCKFAENPSTRAFLSHKRSSAQGLTGRIYQGLKNDYRIFLDSDGTVMYHMAHHCTQLQRIVLNKCFKTKASKIFVTIVIGFKQLT